MSTDNMPSKSRRRKRKDKKKQCAEFNTIAKITILQLHVISDPSGSSVGLTPSGFPSRSR